MIPPRTHLLLPPFLPEYQAGFTQKASSLRLPEGPKLVWSRLECFLTFGIQQEPEIKSANISQYYVLKTDQIYLVIVGLFSHLYLYIIYY